MGIMGNEDYVREELVAEAGAVILAEYFGISTADPARHADYFQYWLRRCPDPAADIAYARRRAEEAVRYILRHGVTTTRQPQEGVV
jgi:antirestriction protein ArdC